MAEGIANPGRKGGSNGELAGGRPRGARNSNLFALRPGDDLLARMGFFDRLAGKPATPPPESPGRAGAGLDPSVAGVAPRLLTARELLEAKDLKGALAVYEEVAGRRRRIAQALTKDLGGRVRDA